jgi:hypothetical protein
VAAVAIPLGNEHDIAVRFDGRVHRLVAKAKALARHEARRLLLPLAVLTAISSLATVASPGLTGRPLLLVALSPRLAFLTLAAPKVGLLPFLAVGMVRLCLADPFHFVLGRRHGTAALDRLPGRRWVDAVRKVAGRSVPLLVFLRPSGTNLAIAGASRSRVLQVVAADLVGTFVYLVLVHQVGHSMLPT